MIPYHYCVVRCRDAEVRSEYRNIALLVVSAVKRQAWLRRGRLDQRAHLFGDEAAFVCELLDALEEEAKEVAREGQPARVHDWLRSRSGLTEDTVSLSAPAVGIATDPAEEAARLTIAYLGPTNAEGRDASEDLEVKILRTKVSYRQSPRPAHPSAPSTGRFGSVREPSLGPLLLDQLAFDLRKPEKPN